MDDKLISVLVGAASGMVGYWINTFWMRPILRYRELRSKVLCDLIFFAQVINPDDLGERLHQFFEQRIESNRLSSASITCCLLELPWWYKKWLKIQGCNPEIAAENLLGLSNTSDYDKADKRIGRIKNALGIKITPESL